MIYFAFLLVFMTLGVNCTFYFISLDQYRWMDEVSLQDCWGSILAILITLTGQLFMTYITLTSLWTL